ncbi:MAG: QacE family quaternary ammonium compound efflux SMR transporter [Paracoccus denitrificans]|nr:MAG: QacE family quaternary ammonium compound efflux SMR transporter [Paracoccus denitrificans]PZO84651.1 MAG: QacE family quaternary ammonium compound efflux SMR transporter [Paracoccus denitrificans]
MPSLATYLALFAAIVAEIFSTNMLQRSAQFTKLGPTVAMALGYALSFYLLSLALREMPLGIAYAVWSGLGIVLVSLLGLFAFGQRLDLPAIIGLTMIVGGVLVINLFSGSVTH